MNRNETLLSEVSFLTLLSIEGKTSPLQAQRLDELLKTTPPARRYYFSLINVYLGLEDPDVLATLYEADASACGNSALLQALAEYEKTAPTVPIESPAPPKAPPAVKKPTATAAQRINRGSLAMAILSLAAMIAMIVYVEFATRSASQPVAEIIDAVDAQWGGEADYRTGDTLRGLYDTLELRQGIVKIRFVDNAETIIEGPAVFSCLSSEKLLLHEGKAYVRVPVGSEGFTVRTQTSKIIDLGTEFGVSADARGTTELHMIKGKASLVAVAKDQTVTSLVLNAGQSCRTHPDGTVDTIPICRDLFVRGFDSANGTVWRSDTMHFSLTDVIGGGNGLGTGQVEQGISLTDGRRINEFAWSDRQGSGQYIPVEELSFVDGVVVPDANDGPPVISSQGHRFAECPDTNGLYFDAIRNGGPIRMTEGETFPMTFNGQVWGARGQPVLFLHANACITFDLEAVRKALPAFELTGFRSRCVLFEKSGRLRTEKADVFVLVDGRARFKQLGFDQNHVALEVDLPLQSGDRFLSLVTTDSDGSIALDWVGFLEPVLVMKTAEPVEVRHESK